MEVHYSTEKAVLLLISLLKAHGIKKVIASPGSTNVCLVASLQSDPYFEIYSSVDERSAAYLACGLARESGEPVVISCTEATASRNYLSGLTEAFYSKLPILAITATNDRKCIGQNHPQMIDRSVLPRDVAKKSMRLPFISTDSDLNAYSNLVNDVILELFRDGGGPAHIEYETKYTGVYDVNKLPSVKPVRRFTSDSVLPQIPQGRVAIVLGAHKSWTKELTNAVENFCEKYDSVVLSDHIGNYHGKYGVNPTIATSQTLYTPNCCNIDTLIYIGDISSSYKKNYSIKNVWRVNPDGELRNVFGNLSCVFEMSELDFFQKYSRLGKSQHTTYYEEWKTEVEDLYANMQELPFSNLWVAQQTGNLLPQDCRLYLGIENTLRTWNFFNITDGVDSFCNTGGFGIDGGVSSLIGASFVHPDKLYFGVTGDLAFFYDMNVLGNRHIGNNIRLLVVNNGIGQQFKNPGHPAAAAYNGLLDTFANKYIAAAGHYGNKSPHLLKHYAEDLGFEYLSASNKEEYMKVVEKFVSSTKKDKSIVLEVFTTTEDETEALHRMYTIKKSATNVIKDAIKDSLKKSIGNKGISVIKKILK